MEIPITSFQRLRRRPLSGHLIRDNQTVNGIAGTQWSAAACQAVGRPHQGDPLARRLSGGSDGSPLREIDVVAPPLVPFLYPERVLRSRHRNGIGRYAVDAKGPRIPRERWPEVAARARREGLRAVARGLGVSHETVRTVVRAATCSDSLA